MHKPISRIMRINKTKQGTMENKKIKGMKLTPSFAIANELAPILADLNLKLCYQESMWYNGKKSTKITIAGYSDSAKKYIVKEYLILSFDAKTIAKVIEKNWH